MAGGGGRGRREKEERREIRSVGDGKAAFSSFEREREIGFERERKERRIARPRHDKKSPDPNLSENFGF